MSLKLRVALLLSRLLGGFGAAAACPTASRRLANFAGRAKEIGGTLAIASSPGRDARVKPVFSFHP